jgi:hypothetical protein
MPFTSLAAVTFAVMGKFCIPMSTSGPLGFGMLDMILISSKNYVLRALSGYSVIACYKDDSKKQRYSCARIQRPSKTSYPLELSQAFLEFHELRYGVG